jgi:hypothetical protein
MGRKQKTDFGVSALWNKFSYIQYMERFKELAISMFDWQNVPDTIDTRYLELMLFERGQVLFFYDKDLGYLALPNGGSGKLNVYGIPVDRRAVGVNGYNKDLDATNSVIIWNNMLHTGSSLEVEMYSRRLCEIDRTIDVNVRAQKTPVLIKCDEHERLTMKNLYMQYDGNSPVIYGDKNLNTNNLQAIQTLAPFISNDLYQLRTQIYNEMLGVLGISNISYQKRERLISDEVIRSLGGTIANRFTRLQPRRDACDAINKMTGLNLRCDYREDYQYMTAISETLDEDGDPVTGDNAEGDSDE